MTSSRDEESDRIKQNVQRSRVQKSAEHCTTSEKSNLQEIHDEPIPGDSPHSALYTDNALTCTRKKKVNSRDLSGEATHAGYRVQDLSDSPHSALYTDNALTCTRKKKVNSRDLSGEATHAGYRAQDLSDSPHSALYTDNALTCTRKKKGLETKRWSDLPSRRSPYVMCWVFDPSSWCQQVSGHVKKILPAQDYVVSSLWIIHMGVHGQGSTALNYLFKPPLYYHQLRIPHPVTLPFLTASPPPLNCGPPPRLLHVAPHPLLLTLWPPHSHPPDIVAPSPAPPDIVAPSSPPPGLWPPHSHPPDIVAPSPPPPDIVAPSSPPPDIVAPSLPSS
ncbi:hypothetical protein GDO81_019824 [Engystomops pustulosus]|uniref:Uncharacterized protein n=1 Tax=Engystomops pustulosus TaxID=76066 RepID=A0AAV6ZKP8_ENGPU|nr:hypothetical protein GDO81_019824 [Engystomops pustulosus]